MTTTLSPNAVLPPRYRVVDSETWPAVRPEPTFERRQEEVIKVVTNNYGRSRVCVYQKPTTEATTPRAIPAIEAGRGYYGKRSIPKPTVESFELIEQLHRALWMVEVSPSPRRLIEEALVNRISVFPELMAFQNVFALVKNGEKEVVRAIGGVDSSKWLAQLDGFLSLRKGWDSYSAPAPTALSVANAKQFVSIAIKDGIVPERVEPSAMGGVGATYSHNDCEVVIEFYNTGKAHALFSNNATEEMHTLPVSTSQEGYRNLLNEVRQYLYGKE